MQIHPLIAPFYEGLWTVTQDQIPHAGLHVPHLRDRMRRDLEVTTGSTVTWETILESNVKDLGLVAGFLEQPLTEYAYAIGLRAGAWLAKLRPGTSQTRLIAVSQAIGELACQESAYGPPDDKKAYRAVFAIGDRHKATLLSPVGTDRVLDELLKSCL